MNQDNPTPIQPIKTLSVAGLLTLLIGFGIIFIGVREFLSPSTGAQGYGVALLDPGDGDLLAVKAARDVVTGILLLTILGHRNRTSLAFTVGVLSLIPILDGLIVFRHAAWTFAPVLLIHWGTAAVMLVIVILIERAE